MNSSNSDSVRASRLLRLRASTRDGNLSPPTGRGSGSSMGNGSRRASQAGTLCGEWACRLIPFTAVCVSMKSVTVSPSRPQLDRLANGNVPQSRPPLRSGKLTTEKKKPSETLTERFRELAVIRSNRVCSCCGMLHNSDYDLCGTENRCANRLWLSEQILFTPALPPALH